MRICSECGKPMTSGYIIHDGEYYFCSPDCLHKNISEEMYLALYDNGNGDSFWTTWEDEDDDFDKEARIQELQDTIEYNDYETEDLAERTEEDILQEMDELMQ